MPNENPQAASNALLARQIIKNMSRRGMDGFYCENRRQALEAAQSYLTPGCTVSWGGSVTLTEIGLIEALKSADCRLLDRSKAKSEEELRQLYSQAMLADAYFMSSNAITLQGELVNMDGNGNRVGCLVWGPKRVVVIAGMNKLVATAAEGVWRIRNLAAPPNAQRQGYQTGCLKTGYCVDCYTDECMCGQLVVTRMSRMKHRIQVILVGETLGF